MLGPLETKYILMQHNMEYMDQGKNLMRKMTITINLTKYFLQTKSSASIKGSFTTLLKICSYAQITFELNNLKQMWHQ
jgi:hypothetical protein